MIGNDVVDLKQATKDSNWNRSRFLDKLFSKKEQDIILSSENIHQLVWLLWSMKEAAYKAYVREFEHSFFNPKRVQCELGLNNEGEVCVEGKLYYVKSIITSEYIHSIASSTKEKHLEWQLFNLFGINQSEEIRAKLITQISNNLDYDSSLLKIQKTVLGVPNLFLNEQPIFEALSMSHHGEYGAFVIC